MAAHLMATTRSPGKGTPLYTEAFSTNNGDLVYRSEQNHRIIILGALGLFGATSGSLHLAYSDFKRLKTPCVYSW